MINKLLQRFSLIKLLFCGKSLSGEFTLEAAQLSKFSIIGILAAFMLVASVSAQAGNYNQCGFGGMTYGNYGIGTALFGWLFMALVIIALVVFIAWMIRQLANNERRRK